MTDTKSPGTAEKMHFTEYSAIKLWSGCLAVRMAYPDFQEVLANEATQTGQMFSGFITKSDNDLVTSFTRTRYPRQRYGILSVADCRSGMIGLANRLETHAETDCQTYGTRIVLGLLEGYDSQAKRYTVDDVRQALPQAKVQAAEIFAARPCPQGTSVYREPAAVIRSFSPILPAVYELADAMKQERFAVEDFGNMTARLVETRHCVEPDSKLG